MQVNGLSGAGSKTAGIKMAQKMDSFSINIKNEIARKQKEQQEISSNKSLSAEEKMKKRQEIQRQMEQKKLSASASQMNTLGTLNQKIADVAKEKEDEDKEVASSFTKC